MRIKHKETNIERSLSFGDWIREYVRKDLYKDWEVLTLENVVKVISLKKDGKVSETLMSKGVAEKHKNQFNGVNGISVKIEKEPVEMEFYQEYLETKILKTKNQSSLNKSSQNHFWNKIRYVIFEKIRPKRILKPIWKFIIIVIAGGLSGLLGYILVEFYKSF
jgi:hypothetical protein